MNKKDLEKNILDLSYKRNLQLLNIILIIGGSTFVASFVGLILNLNKLTEYSILLIIIGVITFMLYNRIDSNLREIANKIKGLIK